MVCILTRHVTHWACLGWTGSTCTQHVPVPANIKQLRTAIEEWDNIPQATINSLINYMWRRRVVLHEANSGYTRNWLVFWSTPLFLFTVSYQKMPVGFSNHVKSIDWFPYINCYSVKSLHAVFIFLFSVFSQVVCTEWCSLSFLQYPIPG
jgi:hypothetical protein